MNKAKYIEIIVLISVFIFTFILVEYPKIENYYDELAHIYFLDIGHGDSTLIKTKNRELILIDGGKSDNLLYKLGEILPYWLNEFDLVIVTHSDYDHISGVFELAERYKIKCILYESVDEAKSETEKKLRNIIADKGIVHLESISDFNNNWEKCLSSNNISNYSLRDSGELSYIKCSNDESIVSIFKIGDFEALFTGDIEKDAISALIDYLPKYDIEVLKIPHQGSRDALFEGLIYKYRPDYGILSIGENGYGHPHSEVVNTYLENNVILLRTDESGTIHFVTDGESWFIEK